MDAPQRQAVEAVSYRGDYDPALFDQADPATWPQPATDYEPAAWWYITAPGVINGTAVAVGDRIYPTGAGRTYGEGTYGEAVYGGDPPPPPWAAEAWRVYWVARAWSSAPGWQRPPAPYAGEPLGETGWRLALEVWRIDPAARLYGSDTYGDGTYGGEVVPAVDWSDLSCPLVAAVIRRGATDGSPAVEVDEATIEVLDPSGRLVPLGTVEAADDGLYRAPTIGTPVRLALLGPQGEPWPLFTGRLDELVDVADRPPRAVEVSALGMTGDLVTSMPLSRPGELLSDRLDALLDLAGYSWGREVPVSAQQLRRIEQLDDAEVLEQLRLAALSGGLVVRTGADGVIRFDPWPTEPSAAPTLEVTDRLDAQPLPVAAAELRADTAELLTVTRLGSSEVQGAAAIMVEVADGPGVGRFGRHSEALGLPVLELSAQRADLEALAQAVSDRHGRIVSRVSRLSVTLDHDDRWLPTLAGLDLGTGVLFTQTEPRAVRWSAVLVGLELRITARPARVNADLYLSTITPTE